MIEQDIFVGLVELLTGLFVFGSAVFQSEWINKFWLVRHIENVSNQFVARFVLMGIGAVFLVLGTLIILGFFSGESRKATASENQHAQLLPFH